MLKADDFLVSSISIFVFIYFLTEEELSTYIDFKQFLRPTIIFRALAAACISTGISSSCLSLTRAASTVAALSRSNSPVIILFASSSSQILSEITSFGAKFRITLMKSLYFVSISVDAMSTFRFVAKLSHPTGEESHKGTEVKHNTSHSQTFGHHRLIKPKSAQAMLPLAHALGFSPAFTHII